MKGKVPHGDSVLPMLLAALATLLFVASPLADLGVISRPLIGATMIIVILAGLFALGGRGRLARPVIGFGVVLLALQAVEIVFPSQWLGVVTEFADAIFLGLLCVVLLLSVFARGPITVHRVLGAIAVYLLLAMFFAETFDIVDRFTRNAFIMGTQPTPYTTPSAKFFYLSTITLHFSWFRRPRARASGRASTSDARSRDWANLHDGHPRVDGLSCRARPSQLRMIKEEPTPAITTSVSWHYGLKLAGAPRISQGQETRHNPHENGRDHLSIRSRRRCGAAEATECGFRPKPPGRRQP